MALCGYPPRDFLEHKEFIQNCLKSLDKIAQECDTIAAIVGAPSLNNNPKGKMLFNSAYFLAEKKIKEIRHKSLLPTYDIFDEYRYFEPNTDFRIIEYKGKKIALTICEDLWDNQPIEGDFARKELYIKSPMQELIKQNPEIIINPSASPFSSLQENSRKEVILKNVRNYKIPLIYVNQVGADNELTFDGGSLFVNKEGEILSELKYFEQDFQIIDTEARDKTAEIQPETTKIGKINNALIMAVKDFFEKMNFKKAILGLSGGIDSAVTAALAAEALGAENVWGILMPSKYSSEHSITDAVQLAENLGMKYHTINIEECVSAFDNSLSSLFSGLPTNVAEENIQSRTRGVLLMALSNKFGNILLNTSNKSELAVGYGTLYGDMNGSISVLGDVYKTDVFKLARFINRDREIIPGNTIIKPPSAELSPDQKDTDSLPDYQILDAILYKYIEQKKGIEKITAEGYDKELVRKVIRMVNGNEFKRFQAPPIIRVSSKAFGVGRKMPLVAKY